MIRTSVDGFHRPRACATHEAATRPRATTTTPAICRRSWRSSSRRSGRAADRRVRTASFDLEADAPVAQERTVAAEDAILIVDGTFSNAPSARPLGRGRCSFGPRPRRRRRAGSADADRLGGEAAARDLYAARYRRPTPVRGPVRARGMQRRDHRQRRSRRAAARAAAGRTLVDGANDLPPASLIDRDTVIEVFHPSRSLFDRFSCRFNSDDPGYPILPPHPEGFADLRSTNSSGEAVNGPSPDRVTNIQEN